MIDALRRIDIEQIARYEDISIAEREFRELVQKKDDAIEAATTELSELKDVDISYEKIALICENLGVKATPTLVRQLRDPTQNPLKVLVDALDEAKAKSAEFKERAPAMSTDEQAEIGNLD